MGIAAPTLPTLPSFCWPVEAPAPSREDLSLSDILRLTVIAAESKGEQYWTTDPQLPLLDENTSAATTTAKLHGCHPETVILTGIFSSTECANIIDTLEKIPAGFGPGRALATGPEAMRRNDVLVWLVPTEVEAALWVRIGPVLRSVLGGGGRGINKRFRVYRYAAGGAFLPHYDASQHPTLLCGADRRSMREDTAAGRSRWSLLMYLNSASAGGEDASAGSSEEGRAAPCFTGGATALMPNGEGGAPVRVTPVAGGGLLFPHGEHARSLLHAGEPVEAGTKYVIRTDVFL